MTDLLYVLVYHPRTVVDCFSAMCDVKFRLYRIYSFEDIAVFRCQSSGLQLRVHRSRCYLLILPLSDCVFIIIMFTENIERVGEMETDT